jgi:pilus assembly protein Flp/PilA
MLRFYRKLREDESGATAIEYGLIAGLISVVIISSLTIVESQLAAVFNYISTTVHDSLTQ